MNYSTIVPDLTRFNDEKFVNTDCDRQQTLSRASLDAELCVAYIDRKQN